MVCARYETPHGAADAFEDVKVSARNDAQRRRLERPACLAKLAVGSLAPLVSAQLRENVDARARSLAWKSESAGCSSDGWQFV
jgi:hypothetical protein